MALSKQSNCKKCYLSLLLLCQPHTHKNALNYKYSYIFWNFTIVTLIHSMSINFSGNLVLLIWVKELLYIISDALSVILNGKCA